MKCTQANERLKYTLSMCRLGRTWRKSTREGAKIGVGRHERMKRGSGMKGRDERSRGIEIRIADAFAIIIPTGPFKLEKQEARRKSMSHGECVETRSE